MFRQEDYVTHDAVLKFYHDRGLNLGFTRNFLKPLKA